MCLQNVVMLSVLYLSTNLVGLSFHVLRERFIHRGFNDTKQCVEARVRLEHERQQQVRASALASTDALQSR